MSTALTHFSFGAACALLVLAVIPVRSRFTHVIAVSSGIWAMVPDLVHVSSVYEAGFGRLADSTVANLFWLHGLFDRLDPGDSHRLAAVMVGVYLLAAALYGERHRHEPVFAWRGRELLGGSPWRAGREGENQ